jgi:protein-S-isoprenylcysteine O-methyltransferase Ste14
MRTQPEVTTIEKQAQIKAGIASRAAQILFSLLFEGAILFLAAGHLDWIWAWVFLGIYLAAILVNSLFMLRGRLETVAERGRPKEMKNWDRVISGLWAVAQYVLLPLIAGLDVRFGLGRDLHFAWHLAGAALFALGLGLFSWAMIANAFFSTVVRIQSERGHSVCRSGPYRIVRHPGYAGAILQGFGIAFLLGSSWALLPAVLAAIMMILRTYFEDRILQAELPGYRDFVQETRYRLLPGVW